MDLPSQDPADSLVHFVGDGADDFEEICGALFTRSQDRGTADTGTRTYEGSALKLADFLETLDHGLPDAEYPGCGINGYSVADAGGNKRRVTVTFRGLMQGTGRDEDPIDSSVFGTISVPANSGGTLSLDFEAPQTEYRYVRAGSKPTTHEQNGVSTPELRPIRVWNAQPRNVGVAGLAVITRCSRFDVQSAGLAWQVSETWTRELTQPINGDFTVSLPNVVRIEPEVETSPPPDDP